MAKHRIPAANSKYYIPKETFLTVVHYCKQYPLWVAELSVVTKDMAIRYDREHVQQSNNYDRVSDMAIRRVEIAKKKEQIEQVAMDVCGDMYAWILQGVCYDLTFYQLQQRGIPCGKDLYYKYRRLFYYEMSQRI